jgi:iduronate 2-sulfatase
MIKIELTFIFLHLFLVFMQGVHAQESKTRPNILLIISDDLRPELGCYGATYMHTPNIDRLANEGMVFRNAYVQQAVCAASRASFLTGCRPETTGADYPYSLYFATKFWPEHPSICEYFEMNGYYVRTYGKIHHGSPVDKLSTPHYSPGVGESGGKYYALPENIVAGGSTGISENTPPVECADVDDEAYIDGLLAQRAVSDLDEYASSGNEKPFFYAVGFKKPHLPFASPRKYWDMYNRDSIYIVDNQSHPLNSPEYSTVNYSLRNYSGPNPEDYPNGLPVDRQKEIRHGYFAAVSYIDALTGKILDKLDELALRENTIVVFISDHGWHLGHQGMWGKSTNFENAARAPMIISAPEKLSNIECKKLVEYVDIYPTLADLAKLKIPDYIEGLSMVPLLDNVNKDWKSAAFSQFPRGNNREGYSVRTDKYRYTEWRNKSGFIEARELYDHTNDSAETVSVAGHISYQNIVEQLSNVLHSGWKNALPAGFVNNSNNPVAPPHVNYNGEPFASPQIITFPETFSSELPYNARIQIQFNYPVYWNGTPLKNGSDMQEVQQFLFIRELNSENELDFKATVSDNGKFIDVTPEQYFEEDKQYVYGFRNDDDKLRLSTNYILPNQIFTFFTGSAVSGSSAKWWDFEGDVSWGSWRKFKSDDKMDYPYENEVKNSDNSSNHVMKYYKGSNKWTGPVLRARGDELFDFSGDPNFSFKLYSPKKNLTIKVRMQNSTDVPGTKNVVASFTVTQSDRWFEYKTNLSAITKEDNYDEMMIILDNNSTTEGTYYIDDVAGPIKYKQVTGDIPTFEINTSSNYLLIQEGKIMQINSQPGKILVSASTEIKSVELYNLMGKKMAKARLTEPGKWEINRNRCANGTYIIAAKNKTGVTTDSKKIVIFN